MTRRGVRFSLGLVAVAFAMAFVEGPRALGQRGRNNGQIVEYICPKCQKVVPHQVGSPAPTQCPHCQTKFDGVQRADGSVRRIDHPLLSNITILGILCGLVIVGAGGAGLFFLIRILTKPQRRRRPRGRDRDDDDFEDDERPRRRRDDDDDRPRRRRRDS